MIIKCVINLPTVSSEYSELYCRRGAWIRASRKSGEAERRVRGRCRKRWSGSGAESGAYRNRLEHTAERPFCRSRSAVAALYHKTRQCIQRSACRIGRAKNLETR